MYGLGHLLPNSADATEGVSTVLRSTASLLSTVFIRSYQMNSPMVRRHMALHCGDPNPAAEAFSLPVCGPTWKGDYILPNALDGRRLEGR
jgi:hypothetical protein